MKKLATAKAIGRSGSVKTLTALLGLFLLTACSDPYKSAIPGAGSPTPAQLNAIAEKLPTTDRDLLLRWGKRSIAGEGYGGEPSAASVRDAIRNQAEFESRQAAQHAEEQNTKATALRLAEAAKRTQQQEHEKLLMLMQAHRQAVNAEIERHLRVLALEHYIEPLTNNFGTFVGRQWKLRLQLTNLTDKDVIGAAGYVTVRDAFGAEIGTYTLRIEPRVLAKKTLTYDVVMPIDLRDPSHRALVEAKTIFPAWFMESVGFRDGTRIDRETVKPPSSPTSVGLGKTS